MSRQGAVVLGLAVMGGIFVAPAPLLAQSQVELEARVRRLEARLEQARLRAPQFNAQLDTVRSGQFTLLTPRQDVERITEAAQAAWREIRTLLRGDTNALGSMTAAILQVDRLASASQLRNVLGESVPIIGLAGWETRDDLAHRLVEHTAAHVFDSVVSPGVREWLSRPATFDSVTAREWTATYVRLASTRHARVRDCYAGVIDSCKTVLWIATTAEPNLEWYPLDEARAVWGESRVPSCQPWRTDAECRAWLRDQQPLPPLDMSARHEVFRLALAVGGDGALGRFTAADGSVAAALEAAADMPIDSLVAHWHRGVVEHRPKATALTRHSAWAAVTWLVLMTLAASRSSRWRS